MKNEVSIEKLINEETKRRLDLMEEKDYEFPERFSKMDYLWAGICVTRNDYWCCANDEWRPSVFILGFISIH